MISESEQLLILNYFNKLQLKDFEKGIKQELIGSAKERKSVNLTDKPVTLKTYREYDVNRDTSALFIPTNSGLIGFENENYKLFNNDITIIHSTSAMRDLICISELEEIALKWIIDKNENCEENNDFNIYLEKQANQLISCFDFYFPVINLDIEIEFKIADVEFCYFTKEHLDEFYNKIKIGGMNEDSFNKIYRKDFQGQALVKTSIKSSKKRAYELAKEKVVYAVDVLKVLSPTPIAPKRHVLFDLRFRLPYMLHAQYLTNENNEKLNYTLNLESTYKPEKITSQFVNSSQRKLIDLFSKFILEKKNTELYFLTKQAIHLTANAFSKQDLHDRVVLLFTIIESLLLEDTRNYKITKKTKARAKKLLSLDSKSQEIYDQLIDEFYDVRHKMIHKAKKIMIDIDNMVKFQFMIIDIIINLMRNQHLETKNRLLEIIDDIQ